MKIKCAICLEEIAKLEIDELLQARLQWPEEVTHLKLPKGLPVIELPVEKPCQIAVLSCGHVFHSACWLRWVAVASRYFPSDQVSDPDENIAPATALPHMVNCPCCRQLPDYVVNQPELVFDPQFGRMLSAFRAPYVEPTEQQLMRAYFRRWMGLTFPNRSVIYALRHPPSEGELDEHLFERVELRPQQFDIGQIIVTLLLGVEVLLVRMINRQRR